MISDKQIHRAFRTHITLDKENPLEKIFNFTIYQNYTLALMFNICELISSNIVIMQVLSLGLLSCLQDF